MIKFYVKTCQFCKKLTIFCKFLVCNLIFKETLELDSWWRRLGFEIGLKQEGELWLERLLHSCKRLKNYFDIGKIVILQPSRNNPLFQLTEVRTDLCIGHINLDAYIGNISLRIRKLIQIKISEKYFVTVNKSGILLL